MNETINIDFLCVVSITGTGLLEYRRLPITMLFEEEMRTLNALYENDNRTVMDLQDYLQGFMPKSRFPKSYNYCAPYSYSSSFISIATYPKLYTFNQYQSKLKDAEHLETISFLSDCDVKHVSELSLEQKWHLNKSISEAKSRVKKNLKKNFMEELYRYLQAHRFYSTLKIVKSDDRNKMYSTENIGWTTFNYQISKDILFFMKSNFGYGRSSYLFINLTYKGIDILPYSALIKYYYVNMTEFYRYTRQYRPSRENWEVALDFVVETANLAFQDETEFITRWIGNEINEMVAGLKIISSKPELKLKEFFRRPMDDTDILYVRNAYKSDENEFLAYPEEISTIFKAEKLSAALVLLEKLKALAPAYPKVFDAIEQIKTLNTSFFPSLKEYISVIEREIKRRQVILKPKIKERDRLKASGKRHYSEMDRLIEDARKKGIYNIQDIRNRYFLSHPDFKRLYDKVEECSEEISKDEHQIFMRESFVRRLVSCKNLIIQHIDVAA